MKNFSICTQTFRKPLVSHTNDYAQRVFESVVEIILKLLFKLFLRQ